jgi:GntR family transcriptional repressor for pyruvate dehydrogenase complex
MADKASFSPVRPVRSYQRIVEQIEDAIIRGELRSGQYLPSEREMMQQFSVSRSTVREAMRVLESDGLIRSRPGNPNGAEVLGFTLLALRRSVDRLVQADQLKLAELIGFRMVLEGTANLMATQLRTDQDLREMQAALAGMQAGIAEGYESFSQADMRFHEVVARASGNALVQLCSQVVRDVVLELIRRKITDAPEDEALMAASLRHHTEVFEAVRAGDPAAAEALARANQYEYYAEYVPEPERASLRALLRPPASSSPDAPAPGEPARAKRGAKPPFLRLAGSPRSTGRTR